VAVNAEDQRISNSNNTSAASLIANGRTSSLRTFILDSSLLSCVKQQVATKNNNNNDTILQTSLKQLVQSDKQWLY
jgi:hypothetical protein